MNIGTTLRAGAGAVRDFLSRALPTPTMAMHVMTLAASACGLMLAWWYFEEPVKLGSEDVIAVVPADRVIDRDVRDNFIITRRICMDDHALASVRREFIDGVVFVTPPGPPVQLQRGCRERPRVVEVPPTLPPGHYTYRATLTFCNRIRCEDVVLHDVPIVVRGRFPVEPQGAPAPIREPL